VIKQEIIEKLVDELFQEEPYLDPSHSLQRVLEFAYRKGYEAAIRNYCIPGGEDGSKVSDR
jgi:hypothetical protein